MKAAAFGIFYVLQHRCSTPSLGTRSDLWNHPIWPAGLPRVPKIWQQGCGSRAGPSRGSTGPIQTAQCQEDVARGQYRQCRPNLGGMRPICVVQSWVKVPQPNLGSAGPIWPADQSWTSHLVCKAKRPGTTDLWSPLNSVMDSRTELIRKLLTKQVH